MDRNPVPLESIEKRRDCDPGGIHRNAALHFRYQAGALDLGLALGAGKGMPAALALAGLRIAHVEDDGPATARAFANMAFHCPPPFLIVGLLNVGLAPRGSYSSAG